MDWDARELWQVKMLMEIVIREYVTLLVIEDFILRTVHGGTQREGISPARVGFALYCQAVTLRLDGGEGVRVMWQQPSQMSVVKEIPEEMTGKRATEHARDAYRHLVVAERSMK